MAADVEATRPPAGAAVPAGWRIGFTLLICAVVALVALLIVELVHGSPASAGQSPASGASNGKAGSRASARNAALEAAINEASTLFSYDYRQLDKDLAAARAVTTGTFTSQYDQVSVPAVKPLAAKYQVVVKATVLAAGVVDDSNTQQIKVLVFVDQVVKNTQLAAPRLDANRTELTMVPVGKGWKVAGVAEL